MKAEAKRGTYALLAIARQMSSRSLRGEASVKAVVASEDKCCRHKCCPSSSFPPHVIAKHGVLWQVQDIPVACLAHLSGL